MEIRYATISKTGRRSNNEDCFNVLEMPEHNCFMGIKSIAPDILQARMLDDKPLEEILDVFDFLCQKQGDDNYTAILMEIE